MIWNTDRLIIVLLLASIMVSLLVKQHEREMSRHLEAVAAEANLIGLERDDVATVGWSMQTTSGVWLDNTEQLRYLVDGKPATRDEFEQWLVRYLRK